MIENLREQLVVLGGVRADVSVTFPVGDPPVSVDQLATVKGKQPPGRHHVAGQRPALVTAVHRCAVDPVSPVPPCVVEEPARGEQVRQT